MALLKKAKRAFSKPLNVVVYRVYQEMKLEMYGFLQFWDRLENRISSHFNRLTSINSKNVLLKDDSSLICKGLEVYKEYYIELSKRIEQGNYKLLGVDIPSGLKFNWNEDWRYSFEWPEKYYKQYYHYDENKEVPYDVKYPWELSRLSFLIPMAMVVGDKDCLNKSSILSIVRDWEDKNKYGMTVNWNPMESSIRAINLVILVELLENISELEITEKRQLYALLVKHAEFIYRNIEYTDVRGNHYTANLAALLILGLKLQGIYPAADKWVEEMIPKLDAELILQFHGDGVNFEKAIGYHRLVTELFLLSSIALSKKNVYFKNLEILKRAVSYIEAYIKADLSAPTIGDNDSASILNFIFGMDIDSHYPVLQLGRKFFGEVVSSTEGIQENPYFIFDIKEQTDSTVDSFHSYKEDRSPMFKHFKEGGVILYKDCENYFILDIGEVGMNGRGGHGHNDLFSYELEMGKSKIISDSGCPTYTGDLKTMRLYRSTQSHNVLQVENFEIAELKGFWQIANTAIPNSINASYKDNKMVIIGSHTGYTQYLNEYLRKFELDNNLGIFTCIDEFQAIETRTIHRYLHLNDTIRYQYEKGEHRLICTVTNQKFRLVFDEESKLRIEKYEYSPSYGVLKESFKLILSKNCGKGTNRLYYKILRD